MFEYEWENSSHILLQPTVDDDASNGASHDGLHHLHRQTTAEEAYSGGGHVDASSFMSPTFLPFAHHNSQNNPYHGFQTVMDPRAFASASYSHAPQSGPSSMLSSADYDSAAFFSTFPKPEPGGQVSDCNNHLGGSSADLDRIGLNLGLGGRTYFSAADEDFLSRLYRRSRPFDGGIGGSLVANSPKCQAEGCNADLSNAKHYHRRHKVCEFHSKASTVVAGGLTQRFCQQCSRFHLLTEFDNGKRSCRRRLADHNRRRRKSHQANASQDRRSLQADKLAGNSSGSENPSKSPSRAHSVSSVTVAVSPSMQESKLNFYSSSASPSASSSSIFY